ncbi:metal ABC transporter ATP-binding protein [Oceanobacillus sp. Castelsardo]|uniref:metal ABC transporter ATP-binding protein n=1 Tax=Oceanobacillus sp. Castelsardo TaxID=1851204 RepID=UPI000838ADDE|nr:metal ABC transporter ATP-binding protein [Oceanobacillus sp. Castelsardo]
MGKALTVDHLHVSYYGKEVIKDVSFSINTGKLVGIIGPNGAGKSTIMKATLGLIPKDKGNVRILEKPLKAVRKKIAYVPQRNNLDWDFPINVIDTVLLGTYPHLGLMRRPNAKQKEWAFQCLKEVGMEDFSKQQIGELSGGQQQRVFLARALAQKAELFFLDEPFVGIDVSSETTIIKILKNLCDKGKTVLVVHHDLTKVEDYFDELILLNKELVEYGPVQQVFKAETISQAYQANLSILKKVGVSM